MGTTAEWSRNHHSARETPAFRPGRDSAACEASLPFPLSFFFELCFTPIALAKKQKGSANRAKAKLKVARLHARIADTRNDFLHKLSTRLINDNQVLAIETLAVSNMQKNPCLAKSISDASWSEFVRQLEYKARWYGRTVVGIDRWYPSSKRCSECGHAVPALPLSVREWTCPECSQRHDRDVNAARNVLTAGLAGLVCGEHVSPVLR